VKFSRLIEEASVEAAIDAVQVSDGLGYSRVWLREGAGLADPRLVVAAAKVKNLSIVLQLDAGVDSAIPPSLPIELAVGGGAGWADALRALLNDSPYQPDPPVWVVAGDPGTVAAAGRAGVGVALAPLDEPEDSEELVSEYEAELSSESARALADDVHALIAAHVSVGDDPDELVGLVERYREAGVDEVIFDGPSAGDQEFVGRVLAEFDDDEVRDAATAKAERLEPAIAAATKRAGSGDAPESEVPSKPSNRKPSKIAARAAKFQEGAVRKMSDGQINLVVGNRMGMRGLFRSMASMYRPSKANGFEGPIEFKLETRRGSETWTIDCTATGATARKEASPDAKLHVEAKLADFLRVGVGEIAAPSAVLSGKLNVRGDFGLALRMGEMFGGKPLA
jgi:putative sterol carrier protein